MQFIGRCSKSVVFVLSAVCVKCEWRRGMFAYAGRSEGRSILGERWSYACVIAYE